MLATLRVRAGSARSIATRLPFRKHTCATLTTKRYLSSTSAGTDEPDRGIPTPPTPLSIDGLLYASDAVRIRQVLEKETRDTISWSEFMGVVDSLGIPSQRGSHIAEDLQHTGIILFTEAGVCLRPASLLSAITSPPPGAFTPAIAPRRAATPRRAVAELDTKARTSAQRVFVGGGVLLTLQNLVLFRLTYWELGWDAVEPMTYFANAAGVLAWYWFFVAANSEACYLRAFDLVYQRQRARLYKMAGFVTADDESPVSAAGPGAARQKQSPSSDADATT